MKKIYALFVAFVLSVGSGLFETALCAAAEADPVNGINVSVATVDVMAEANYAAFFNYQGSKRCSSRKMAVAARQALFNASFADQDQLANKDFIALQEYGLGIREREKKNGLVGLQLGKSGCKALSGHLQQSRVKGLVVELLYNPNRFELVNNSMILDSADATNQRYVGAVFQSKQDQDVHVGVVSLHFQAGTFNDQAQALQADINRVSQKIPGISQWIVMGNFNEDMSVHTLIAKHKNLLGTFNFAHSQQADDQGFYTAFGKQTGTNKVKRELVDGILYRGKKPYKTSVFPGLADADSQLLTQGNIDQDSRGREVLGNDVGRNYFSSHVIVSADFKVGDYGRGAQEMPAVASRGGVQPVVRPDRVVVAERCVPAERAESPVTISIASSNVLAEGLYDQYFNPVVANKKVYKMPYKTRQELLSAAFQDRNQLAGKDFVLLQEYGPGITHQDGKAGVSTMQVPLGSGYTSLVGYVNQNQQALKLGSPLDGGVADLLFNARRFTLIEPIIGTRTDATPDRLTGVRKKRLGGRYIGGIFASTGNLAMKVGVVSAHISYDKWDEQLPELVQHINQMSTRYPDVAGWLLAGDFNINDNEQRDPKVLAAKDSLKKYVLPESGPGRFEDLKVGTQWGGRYTALGKSQVESIIGRNTSKITQQEGIDYIFYRAGDAAGGWRLRPVEGTVFMYPVAEEHVDRLLTSGYMLDGVLGNDSKRTFYSDHAIVSAQFTVEPCAGQVGMAAAEERKEEPRAAAGLVRAPARRPEQPRKAAPAGVACPACTFENEPGAAQCEICYTRLMAGPAVADVRAR